MSDENIWGWLVVLYLWVAGMAGGAYIAGYLTHHLNGGRHRRLLRTATWISIPLFVLGMLFLTLDLGRPERFWHMFISFRPSSVMWVGTYILLIGSVVGAGLAIRELAETLGIRIPAADQVERVVTFLGFIFALVVIGYVGVVFAQSARTLWAGSLLLPWLFVASALSTGIALLVMALHLIPPGAPPFELVKELKRLDVTFIAVELVLLAIFLVWLAAAGPAGRTALGTLVSGSMGVVFWIGLVVVGLVVPLLAEWRSLRVAVAPLAPQSWVERGGPAAVWVPALVLLGGLLLRYVVVFAGQAVP